MIDAVRVMGHGAGLRTDSTHRVAPDKLPRHVVAFSPDGRPTSRRFLSSPVPPSPAEQAKVLRLRSWRVSILRARPHYIGDVHAPDQKSAEAAAVAEFNLDHEQRKRLMVRERE